MTEILSIQSSDKHPDLFAAFGSDQKLYFIDKNNTYEKELARFPEINKADNSIHLYFHEPYICITERFGQHAAVFDTSNGKIQNFTRGDYYAGYSSFSIGFLEISSETLLIHQSDWNRLDITSLKTGKLLTERDIYIAKQSFDSDDVKKQEDKNFLDYFHSLIHVSPDSRYFLSNGWNWHPFGNILCFNTAKFFENYELCGLETEHMFPYNWDRPCTFIDNHTFVIAADDESMELVEDEKNEYTYQQLWFYEIDETKQNVSVICRKKEDCRAFQPKRDGEICGELYYDEAEKKLVAIGSNGGHILYPNGEILLEYPQMACNSAKSEWKYSTNHHFFYNYDNNKHKIITICPFEKRP